MTMVAEGGALHWNTGTLCITLTKVSLICSFVRETQDKSKQIKKQVEMQKACNHHDDAINNRKRK